MNSFTSLHKFVEILNGFSGLRLDHIVGLQEVDNKIEVMVIGRNDSYKDFVNALKKELEKSTITSTVKVRGYHIDDDDFPYVQSWIVFTFKSTGLNIDVGKV